MARKQTKAFRITESELKAILEAHYGIEILSGIIQGRVSRNPADIWPAPRRDPVDLIVQLADPDIDTTVPKGPPAPKGPPGPQAQKAEKPKNSSLALNPAARNRQLAGRPEATAGAVTALTAAAAAGGSRGTKEVTE